MKRSLGGKVMKRLKPLIKMELPSALIVGIIFFLINCLAFAMIQFDITSGFEQYIIWGVNDYIEGHNIGQWNDLFRHVLLLVTVLYGCSFVGLVCASFRTDKDHETGRFLKALPFTMRERVFVKIGLAMSSFLINFVILSVGMFFLRAKVYTVYREIFEVTNIEGVVRQIFSVGFIAKSLLFLFLICIGFYLFLVTMQFMMSHNVGSVVSSVFIFFAPIFLLASIVELIGDRYRGFINWLGYVVVELLRGPIETGLLMVDDRICEEYQYIDGCMEYVGFWSIFILIMLIAISRLSRTYSVEKSDIFINNKVFRVIYMVGVAVCGAFLLTDAYILVLNREVNIICYIVLLVGLVISGVVSYKIGHIGMMKRHQEVQK